VSSDTAMVSDILSMIAPAFEYNPRRMKQFINAFRLKTFIASRTLLFEAPANHVKYDSLTVHQLGKFVAICLRWPLLLADLDNDRDLLSKLQKLAQAEIDPGRLFKESEIKVYFHHAPVADVVTITSSVQRWYQRNNLREFLRVGLFSDGNPVDEATRRKYSLEKLNVDKLLQVSPVKKPIASDEPTTDSKAPGAGSNGKIRSVASLNASAAHPKTYP
jgi:hypothetical protein